MSDLKKKDVDDAYSFRIIINDHEWENAFSDDVRIDRTNLPEEFAEHSRKYAYYSTLCAMAKDQEARDKRLLELYYANIDAEVRSTAVKNQIKLTEKMVENSVMTDERYQKQHLKYLDSKLLADCLRGLEQGFSHRKEMLISLGAHDRIGATDPRVKGIDLVNKQKQQDDEEIEEDVNTGKKRKPKNQ